MEVMHRIEFLDILPFEFYHWTDKRLTVCMLRMGQNGGIP